MERHLALALRFELSPVHKTGLFLFHNQLLRCVIIILMRKNKVLPILFFGILILGAGMLFSHKAEAVCDGTQVSESPAEIGTYTATANGTTVIATMTYSNGSKCDGSGSVNVRFSGRPSITLDANIVNGTGNCPNGQAGLCNFSATFNNVSSGLHRVYFAVASGFGDDQKGPVNINVYSCRGTDPANSQFCAGSDQGLTQDTQKTLTNSCSLSAGNKCIYECAAGYQYAINAFGQPSCVVIPATSCKIDSLGFTPSSVSAGQNSTLNWSVSNAVGNITANCNGGARYSNNTAPASGSWTATAPNQDVFCTIGCSGADNRTVSGTVKLTVTQPTGTINVSARHSSNGSACNANWTITGGSSPLSGSGSSGSYPNQTANQSYTMTVQSPSLYTISPASSQFLPGGSAISYVIDCDSAPGGGTVHYSCSSGNSCVQDNASSQTYSSCLSACGAGAATFSCSITPGTQSVAPGSGASYNIALNPQNGWTGSANVSVSVAGNPAGISATGPATLSNVNSSGNISANTQSSAGAGNYTINANLTEVGGSGKTASCGATLGVTAPSCSFPQACTSVTVPNNATCSQNQSCTDQNGVCGSHCTAFTCNPGYIQQGNQCVQTGGGSCVFYVTPSTAQIYTNQAPYTRQYGAFDLTDPNNPMEVTPQTTWGIGNSSIARIDQNGLVTAVAQGTTNIKASYTRAPGQVCSDNTETVNVDQGAPPTCNAYRIFVDPTSALTIVGQQKQFRAYLVNNCGLFQDITTSPSLTWNVVDGTIATNDGRGQVTGLVVGNTQVKASMVVRGTLRTGTAILSVTANSNQLNFTVTPNVGPSPLSSLLNAVFTSPNPGTTNYTFWWNCNYSGTDVADTMGRGQCGDPTDPAIGAKFDNVNPDRLGIMSQSVQHIYTADAIAKVIVEHGIVNLESRKPVTISNSCPSGQVAPYGTCFGNSCVIFQGCGPSACSIDSDCSGPPTPTDCTITANPAMISQGGSSRLTWSCQAGVGSCTLSQVVGANSTSLGSVTPSGTQSVKPPKSAKYVLSCTKSGNPVETSVNVRVLTIGECNPNDPTCKPKQ